MTDRERARLIGLLRDAARALQPASTFDAWLPERLRLTADQLARDAYRTGAVTGAVTGDDHFWSDAANILCRVFDDFDEAMEEFRAFYDPAQWLHGYRALGAFIRQRLDRNPPESPDCSETPKGSEKTEMSAGYPEAVKSARNGHHSVESVRDDRRDHDRHPPRVL